MRHSWSNPQFGATYTYLVDRRIAGGGLPTNNVADWFIRTTTYNSSYYALALIAVLVIALLWVYRRRFGSALGIAGGRGAAGGAGHDCHPAHVGHGRRARLAGRGLCGGAASGVAGSRTWIGPSAPFGSGLAGWRLRCSFLRTSRARTSMSFKSPWLLLAGMLAQAAWDALAQRHRAAALGLDGRRDRGGVGAGFWPLCVSDVCADEHRAHSRSGRRSGPRAIGGPMPCWITGRCLAFRWRTAGRWSANFTPRARSAATMRPTRSSFGRRFGIRADGCAARIRRPGSLRSPTRSLTRRAIALSLETPARQGLSAVGRGHHRRRPAHGHLPAQPRLRSRCGRSDWRTTPGASMRPPTPNLPLGYPVVEPSITHPWSGQLRQPDHAGRL